MRLIDADALYERLKADEELARDRVIYTPNGFPNGMLNPAAVRYRTQLTERTRLKEIVYDAPTIEERKVGRWTSENACEFCGFQPWFERDIHTLSFCPNCGADMRGEQHEAY